MKKILSLIAVLYFYHYAFGSSSDSVEHSKIYHVTVLFEGAIIVGGGIADYFEKQQNR